MPARQAGRHDCRDRLSSHLALRETFDNVVVAETPEGILLELRPAGLGARFYAFMLDWLLRLALTLQEQCLVVVWVAQVAQVV